LHFFKKMKNNSKFTTLIAKSLKNGEAVKQLSPCKSVEIGLTQVGDRLPNEYNTSRI